MSENNYIAQCRYDNYATVRVLRIAPNQIVECDRGCACLKESRDGSVQCSIGWIKKMVNFKITALIIDYEIIMDRNADCNWDVCASHFPIIDDTGHIHEGEEICDSIISPKGLSGGVDTLYPGTRGKYRIYYETFPKDGKLASIMVHQIGEPQSRIDFSGNATIEDVPEERPIQRPVVPQGDQDLRERVATLEKQMIVLSAEVNALRESLKRKDAAPYTPKTDVMSDPGIGYHPLDKK